MSSRAKSATRVKRKTTPNSYRAGMNKPNLNSSIRHNGSQTESNSTPNNCRGRTRARGNHALSNRSSETRTNHQSTLSNSSARNTGNPTTAPGNNVAATAATASLTTGFADTLGRSMGSASTVSPSWLLADTRAFNTAAI